MRKLTLSLAVMAALLPARGYSLGLGEIELYSALNQELNAEIEVMSATSDDANQMIVQLANRDAFSRAGIDRPYLLQQLQFKIVEKEGKPFVKVFTKSAIREPFISFLLEIDWPQGHLLREYTLLLDPPVYNTGASSSSGSSESSHPFIDPADLAQAQSADQGQQGGFQGTSSQSSAQTGSISSDSGRSMNYSMPQTAKPTRSSSVASPMQAQAAEEYRVKQTDTLWSMANRMRPDSSVSVEQMMLALVRKNPEAFIKENINGVKRGYILRLPNRDEATQLDRQQAIAQAREHAALWREYSQSSAAQAPASAMEAKDQAAEQSVADDGSQGHLSIVGASDEQGSEHAGSSQDPASELGRLKQELAMTREQLESERVEKEGLRSRLTELEEKVQSVIQLDDGGLATLQQELRQQQQVEATEPLIEEPVAEEMVEPAVTETAETEPVEPEVLAEPEAGLDDGVIEAASEELVESDTSADAPAGDAVFVDEVDATAETEPTEPADVEMMVESADTIEPPAFAQQKPKSFLQNLMNDPKLLGMIGGGLAFVLLLVVLLLKRIRGGKKANQDDLLDQDDFSDMGESHAETMDAVSASDLGMDDTQIDMPAMDEDSLENTVFGLDDSGAKSVADDQQDDVLAEADVYLAYGIYQQAEDLLKNAIDQNPARDDYRMKLLETHFAAKNAHAFEQVATEAKIRKSDDKSYWGRVATMGAELCPSSELFTGDADVITDFDADSLLPERPATTDVELEAGVDDFASSLEDDLALDFNATTETEVMPGGLGLGNMSDLGTDSSADADELDLAADLAGLTSEFEAPQSDALAEDEDEVASLEFDLGELSDDVGGEAETSEAVSAEDEIDELDIDEDFSLDFAASDLGFEEHDDEPHAPAEEMADELELDADLDLASELDEETPLVADVDDDSLEMDFTAELGDDLGDLALDDGLEDAMLDDSGLDLDDDLSLDDSADLDASMASTDDEFDISELSDDLDEVSTKLDLAKAYIDMGDKEGARSILEEVKAEGTDQQREEAESLLQQAG